MGLCFACGISMCCSRSCDTLSGLNEQVSPFSHKTHKKDGWEGVWVWRPEATGGLHTYSAIGVVVTTTHEAPNKLRNPPPELEFLRCVRADLLEKLPAARQLVRLWDDVGVLGSMIVEEGGRDATRVMAFVVAALTLVIITSGVRLLPPERMEFQGRGGENPLKAVRDVISNRHARLLLVVMFIDAIGTGGIGVLTPFVLDYVVGRPDLLGYMLGINMGATFLGIPIWLRLGRRYEKRRLLLLAMFGSGIGYGSITLVSEGTWWVIAVSGLIAGLSSSCPNVLGYTLKSEIVDVDEYTTGERKEGAYFAGWSFVNKLAAGIMIGLVGWALEWSGFDGQADAQTEFVKTTMVVLMGGFPLVCYAIGAALFSRFSLTEAEHARIRLALDERRADATPG